MACCVCVLVCPAAKLPSEVDGSKYVPSRRPPARLLPQEQQAGRRAGDRHAPSHHVVVVITTMNDCAMRTLYDAHHWCAAARWPAHQAPRHTRHICILCVYIYTTAHTTLAAAASHHHQHHLPRRRSRPTISAYYRIIRRHVIEYVGTWMEHHQSQREEKGAAAAAETNVIYGSTYIYIYNIHTCVCVQEIGARGARRLHADHLCV
jgi:hypothetical protein